MLLTREDQRKLTIQDFQRWSWISTYITYRRLISVCIYFLFQETGSKNQNHYEKKIVHSISSFVIAVFINQELFAILKLLILYWKAAFISHWRWKVFCHNDLQLKSRTIQQWNLPLGFKKKVEVSQVCNAVIVIVLSHILWQTGNMWQLCTPLES